MSTNGQSANPRSRTSRALAVAAALTTAAVGGVLSTDGIAGATGSVTLEATFTTVGHGWERVERWYDSDPGFHDADYPSDGRLDQTGQRQTFFDGVARPAAGRYLLSYAPGWDTNAKPTPVLLVPGAYETADFAWADPSSGPIGCGATSCPTTGMMQDLSSAGYKTFAITFPHIVGNNYNHAEQIHDAIQTIKSRTGASSVDVVAWSMGTVSARMYASSVNESWGTDYQGDIRKLVLIGGPNNGWDYTFRHGTYPAIASYSECGGSVIGGTAALWQNCYGWLYTHPELTPYVTSAGDFFPGIRQMLERWDSVYPVNLLNPDAYTTYYGGTGLYGQSLGINYAIAQGSLIDPMRAGGVPAAVSTYLLCGTARDIPSWNNEFDGPSDGTILLASCLSTGGIGTVVDSETIHVNHLELTYDSAAVAQTIAWLG